MTKKPNGYDLSRRWFAFAFENCDKVTANHTALYLFLCEINNRLGWAFQFQITSTECMAGMSARSHNTYIKVFKDLTEWGFVVLVKKSTNQHQCNIIALSKFDKPLDGALDKALANHLTEHLTYSKTSNHKPQTTNNIEPKKFGSDSDQPSPPKIEQPPATKAPKKIAQKIKTDLPLAAMEKQWAYHLELYHQVAYYADGAERGALAYIAKKLLFQVNQRIKKLNIVTLETDQQKILSAWGFVLDNFAKWSEFNKKLTKLSQINGQFTNIIAECKSGSVAAKANRGQNNYDTIFVEAAQKLHGDIQ